MRLTCDGDAAHHDKADEEVEAGDAEAKEVRGAERMVEGEERSSLAT